MSLEDRKPNEKVSNEEDKLKLQKMQKEIKSSKSDRAVKVAKSLKGLLDRM